MDSVHTQASHLTVLSHLTGPLTPSDNSRVSELVMVLGTGFLTGEGLRAPGLSQQFVGEIVEKYRERRKGKRTPTVGRRELPQKSVEDERIERESLGRA